MRTLIYIHIFLLLALAFSCASHRSPSGLVRKQQTAFWVGAPQADWKLVSFRGADRLWIHEPEGATLMVHSLCEPAQDIPLEALSAQLLVGFTEISVQKREKRPHDGREALISTFLAKLDGVPRHLRTFILKKDGCVYDVVLSAPSAFLPSHELSFDQVVQGLYTVSTKTANEPDHEKR